MLDPDSLERLVPDAVGDGATGKESLQLHLERYEFAANRVQAQRVLDIACGVGYGTHLLAESHADASAVGVDISAEAIEYARDRYQHPSIRFVVSDVYDFRDDAGFDLIVSLETIEHLPDPRGFVERVRAMLRPGGVLVASAPVTPSTDANPHHLTDFSPQSFRRLFTGMDLREVDDFLQVQPYSASAVAKRSEDRLRDMRSGLATYYLTHPRQLLRRVAATIRYGFTNRYLTVALECTRAES